LKNGEKVIYLEAKGKEESITVDEILAGAGRAPNVEGLNLEAVTVQYDKAAGQVCERLFADEQSTRARALTKFSAQASWRVTPVK
jgi:pyruvate/2-oxoglutarate dehydrogenase complex dihydrolipoamide dehydrogenase (E3) component